MTTFPAILTAQAARPLRHWSNAALERAGQAIERAWRDWCARWQLTGAEAVAWNACDDSASADVVSHVWAAARSSWLSTGPNPVVGTLGKVLFRDGSPQGAPIAQALATEALSDLLRAIDQLSVGVDKVAGRGDDAPPAADLRRWSGALRVRLIALRDDQPVSWHLHCGERLAAVLCGGVPPTSSIGRAPLIELAEAMGARPVALKVFLDETTLTLGTLQSLHVGDVLPLSHRLDQPLRVVPAGATRDAPSFCAAFLGSRGHHRAVELVSAAPAPQSTAS